MQNLTCHMRVAIHAYVIGLTSSKTIDFFLTDATTSMSMALRGASDRDFEQSAQWLANAIKWYLSPKTAVRFIRRVVEIIQAQSDYQESRDMCEGFCAHPNCHMVCARAIATADVFNTRWRTCAIDVTKGSSKQGLGHRAWSAYKNKVRSRVLRISTCLVRVCVCVCVCVFLVGFLPIMFHCVTSCIAN